MKKTPLVLGLALFAIVGLNKPAQADTCTYAAFNSAGSLYQSTFLCGSGGGAALTLVAGPGISLTGTATSPIINNTGILSLLAGPGISATGTASSPTINNLGVLSLTAGTNVTISGTAQNPVINAASGGGVVSFNATLAAIGGLTHYWKLNDAAASTAPVDSIGTANLAIVGTPTLGSPPLIKDGEGSVYFNRTTGSYLTIPISVLPTTGSWTFGAIVSAYSLNGTAVPVEIGSNATAAMYPGNVATNPSTWSYQGGGASNNAVATISLGVPTLVVLVNNGTNTLFYVNGAPVGSSPVGYPDATLGHIGAYHDATLPFSGQVEKVFTSNTAFTPLQVRNLFFSMLQ